MPKKKKAESEQNLQEANMPTDFGIPYVMGRKRRHWNQTDNKMSVVMCRDCESAVLESEYLDEKAGWSGSHSGHNLLHLTLNLIGRKRYLMVGKTVFDTLDQARLDESGQWVGA